MPATKAARQNQCKLLASRENNFGTGTTQNKLCNNMKSLRLAKITWQTYMLRNYNSTWIRFGLSGLEREQSFALLWPPPTINMLLCRCHIYSGTVSRRLSALAQLVKTKIVTCHHPVGHNGSRLGDEFAELRVRQFFDLLPSCVVCR